MATSRGRASTPLIELVGEQHGRFNVFQLMRLLLQRRSGSSEGSWPASQRLRFHAELGAGFQGQEIARLKTTKPLPAFRLLARSGAAQPKRIAIHTANYCVAGELGPLPAPFLEWVRDDQRFGDRAMAAFLDVFNQRLHVLRYELKQRVVRGLDSSLPADSRYADKLAAMMGIGLPGQQAQIPLSKRAWLGMAGVLSNCRRSAQVVTQVLCMYLSVPVHLQMLVGRWRDIENSDRIGLGKRNHSLGQTSLLGKRMWDGQASVRLEIGQMSFERACALLPLSASRSGAQRGGEETSLATHEAFVSLIHLLLNRRYDCEVCIELDPESIPLAYLKPAGKGLGLRLGQTAWLNAPGGNEPRSVMRFWVKAFDEIPVDIERAAA